MYVDRTGCSCNLALMVKPWTFTHIDWSPPVVPALADESGGYDADDVRNVDQQISGIANFQQTLV